MPSSKNATAIGGNMEATAEQLEMVAIAGAAASVSEAMRTRHSIRRFDAKPVEQAKLNTILETSLRAPSWKNSQPWNVHIVQGAKLAALREKLTAAALAGAPTPDIPWTVSYPADAKR